MNKLEFDIEFCELPLWVKVGGEYGDWSIEDVEFYYTSRRNNTVSIDWESAFNYDFFIEKITEKANQEWECRNDKN